MSPSEAPGVLIGVELGGTKIVVASSIDGETLHERRQMPTSDPSSTLAAIRRSIEGLAQSRSISTIGVASFGPIDLRPQSTEYGRLISTPKPGWSNVDVVGGITGGFGVPFGADTDVNAALIAEKLYGAGRSFDHVAYLTVGTGVGGGIWTDGRVLHGANHPEIGHIRVSRHADDNHRSSCPFHDDCLEGMTSGTAVLERWGCSAEELGRQTDAASSLVAWYLAEGIATLCSVIPVDVVIIGGGLAKLPGLHDEVTAHLRGASGNYPPVPFAESGPVIVPPGLGDDAGVLGAIEIARMASRAGEDD